MFVSLVSFAVSLIALAGAPPTAVERPEEGRVALDPYLPLTRDCNRGLRLRYISGILQASGDMQGELDASERFNGGQRSCSGFVPELPQFCVHLPVAGTYSFAVSDSGGVDSVLVLVDSDDLVSSCDDDSNGGLRPRATAELEAGTYYVYVGTFSRGSSGVFDLTVTRQ